MSAHTITTTTTQPQTTTDPGKLPRRGLASQLFNAAHDCYNHLREQHAYAWHALRHAPNQAIALYPCFVDGKATTAIGLIGIAGNTVVITPLFIAPTDDMEITGHAGQPTVDYPSTETEL